jgi:hypothetical protein
LAVRLALEKAGVSVQWRVEAWGLEWGSNLAPVTVLK